MINWKTGQKTFSSDLKCLLIQLSLFPLFSLPSFSLRSSLHLDLFLSHCRSYLYFIHPQPNLKSQHSLINLICSLLFSLFLLSVCRHPPFCLFVQLQGGHLSQLTQTLASETQLRCDVQQLNQSSR